MVGALHVAILRSFEDVEMEEEVRLDDELETHVSANPHI